MTVRQARLMFVSSNDNNNKFYNMIELRPEDVTEELRAAIKDPNYELVTPSFLAHWGRVGAKGQKKVFPMGSWDAKYNQKVHKKLYTDNTNLMATKSTQTEPEADPLLDEIIKYLSDASVDQVRANYELADFGSVTQAQIDEVNVLLKAFGRMVKKQAIMFALNKQLELIWTVLPRKISNVRDQKVTSYQEARDRLEVETDMVEALAAQAQVATGSGKTVTESLGLTVAQDNTMLPKLFSNFPYIKDYDDHKRGRVVNFWRIDHGVTGPIYDAYKQNTPRPIERLYFHGSRRKNWLSIFNTGLLIRPPGVTTNGDMFGTGIYFADQDMKSLGYTDMRSVGRWAKGDREKGFLAVFKVNVGNPFILRNRGDHKRLNIHDEDQLGLNKLRPFNFDSVQVYQDYRTSFGQHIYNNEFIIYEAPRSTICGFVEVNPV